METLKRHTLGTRRRKLASAVTFLLVVMTTAAFAAWLSSIDSNPATGKIGSLPSFSSSAVVAYTGTSPLMPGGTGSVQLSIHNPSSTMTYHLTSWQAVQGSSPATFTVAGPPAAANCAAYVLLNTPDKTDLGGQSPNPGTTNVTVPLATPIALPPGDTTVEIPDVLYLGKNTDTRCQGGNITLTTPNSFKLTVSA